MWNGYYCMSIVNHNWNHLIRAIITLLFLDRTHGRARRWCSMAVRGNREKQAAYRNRSKRPHGNRLKQAAHRKRSQENQSRRR